MLSSDQNAPKIESDQLFKIAQVFWDEVNFGYLDPTQAIRLPYHKAENIRKQAFSREPLEKHFVKTRAKEENGNARDLINNVISPIEQTMVPTGRAMAIAFVIIDEALQKYSKEEREALAEESEKQFAYNMEKEVKEWLDDNPEAVSQARADLVKLRDGAEDLPAIPDPQDGVSGEAIDQQSLEWLQSLGIPKEVLPPPVKVAEKRASMARRSMHEAAPVAEENQRKRHSIKHPRTPSVAAPQENFTQSAKRASVNSADGAKVEPASAQLTTLLNTPMKTEYFNMIKEKRNWAQKVKTYKDKRGKETDLIDEIKDNLSKNDKLTGMEKAQVLYAAMDLLKKDLKSEFRWTRWMGTKSRLEAILEKDLKLIEKDYSQVKNGCHEKLTQYLNDNPGLKIKAHFPEEKTKKFKA